MSHHLEVSAYRFEVGDHIETTFNGKPTIHAVAARKLTPHSQSGASYRLLPAPHNCSPNDWIDEGWLKPTTGYSERMDDDE